MKKFGFLFFAVILAMVFCSIAKGEIITEIQNNKIFVFEKTKIKEGNLPDKDLNVPDKIAKELFSGQKTEHIFDQKIITDIVFFNWSFFPKPIGKIITTRVVYSEKVGWISEILKETPDGFSLKLVVKVAFSFMIGILIFLYFLIKRVIKTMAEDKESIYYRMVFIGVVGVVLLFLHKTFFNLVLPKTQFFLEYLLWSVANVVVIITTYYILKFCVLWRKNKIREKEKMEDEKRQQDSVQQKIRQIGQKHRD